jgi:hypothetical protein
MHPHPDGNDHNHTTPNKYVVHYPVGGSRRHPLLTGDAGLSAEPLHGHGELLGLGVALRLTSARDGPDMGFCSRRRCSSSHTTKTIKVYILGTSDT